MMENKSEERKEEKHKTVLLEEAVEALNVKEGGVVVDATLGAGGHTLKIVKKVGDSGKVIAFDLDRRAIEKFVAKNDFTVKEKKGRIYVIEEKPLILVQENFKNIKQVVKDLYSIGDLSRDRVNGVLADLGWRIEQVQDKEYGMSFQNDAPLDMRFDLDSDGLTAREIVNQWSAEELANIFKELGEESRAGQIAQAIVERREQAEIVTTGELADLVREVKGEARGKLHPATKVFQALRIAVNGELSNLQEFLENAFDVLESKGRLVIISFHSLEDRLVKDFFRAKARGCVCPKEIPICVCGQKRELKVISSGTIRADKNELALNPRARSASLRIAQRIQK